MRFDRIKGKFEHYGVLVIPVEANGFALEFMVDTGTSFCSLNRTVATRIGIDLKNTRRISVAPAFGKVTQVPFVQMEILKLGVIEFKNIMFTVLDFPPQLRVDGLLGMNVLKKFRFTIEPDTATLVLRRIPK